MGYQLFCCCRFPTTNIVRFPATNAVPICAPVNSPKSPETRPSTNQSNSACLLPNQASAALPAFCFASLALAWGDGFLFVHRRGAHQKDRAVARSSGRGRIWIVLRSQLSSSAVGLEVVASAVAGAHHSRSTVTHSVCNRASCYLPSCGSVATRKVSPLPILSGAS